MLFGVGFVAGPLGASLAPYGGLLNGIGVPGGERLSAGVGRRPKEPAGRSPSEAVAAFVEANR